MNKKKAFITGITGQDGSYLAEFLLNRGYEVYGLVRRSSTFNTSRIDHLSRSDFAENLRLYHGDVNDQGRLASILAEIKPDEIYNLAAQSHVRVSFDVPHTTQMSGGIAFSGLLESVRVFCPEARVYQASSSEMFGNAPSPQNENSNFEPRSPYAVAKLSSYWNALNYREGYGLNISNGILFNHEGPRRGATFLTRKVSRGVAAILRGEQKKIVLGNLEAKRDWGYAAEYIVAMWLINNSDDSEDFVVGTGHSISVLDFVSHAFSEVGLDWKKYVEIDEKYMRPTEVNDLRADPSKMISRLKWQPVIYGEDLARLMVRHDIDNPAEFSPELVPEHLWRDYLA